MSERKVLNKYFPPDFDPAAIPRRKQPRDAQHKVRLMTPYAMRCETCGEYIYKGKKFNARKETVEGETYYSIKIFRFYIKCPRCSAEITFKTDPQNADYVAEHGASRNFEPWREERQAGELSRLQKEQEEENNPMKALENRTLDSKREMDILDALDEIRTRNARNERVDADAILDRMIEEEQHAERRVVERLADEDERLARNIFHTADGETVRRAAVVEPTVKDLLGDHDIPRVAAPFSKRKAPEANSSGLVVKKSKTIDSKATITASVQKDTSAPSSVLAKVQLDGALSTSTTSSSMPASSSSKAKPVELPATAGLASLLGDYGSEGESD